MKGSRLNRLLVGALISLGVTAAPAPAAARQDETAVLAGGCFWGMESVFEHVKGVRKVVSGYSGGRAEDANYEAVSSERTGHAEAVKITYDPSQISFSGLLNIFFSVAHDPTQVDRQGPDVGRSYRSAIFPQSAEQARLASLFIEKWAKASHAKVATRIEQGRFYAAEDYHQGYARNHPFMPYILINDRPKLIALKQKFPSLYTSGES